MGWKTLCCVRPKVVDQRESPPIQAPTNSSHKTAELQAAHTPGGRTLLVTAQSGSAREFEGYVRPSSVRPGLSVPLQLPCGAQSSKDTQADGVAGCNQACSAVEAERPAVSSYSCPVGDMQRPPGSLLEASVRRRNRAGRPQARQHAGLKEEESLDNQQLTTIMRFMSVYKGQLDGTSFQLVEEMSPLLADGLVLRAHDGKIYNGRDAALRRLQHGISTLQRMAGKEAAVAKSVMENFKMELPVKAGDNQWVVKYAMKRGLFRINIRNTFSMDNHLIASLHVSRS